MVEFERICFRGKSVDEVIDIVKHHYYRDDSFSISMIPSEFLDYSVNLWLAILQLDSGMIDLVPNDVLLQEDFYSKLDKVKYYNFIPKQYLTRKDFLNARKHYKDVYPLKVHARIKSKNHYEWIKISEIWYAEEQFQNDNRILFELICQNNCLSFPEEYFSQEIADMIWNSQYWFSKYHVIPEKYLREEWKAIIGALQIRFEFFSYKKTAFGMEKKDLEFLIKYFSNFKSKEELISALKLEKKIIENDKLKKNERCIWDLQEEFEWLKKLWDCMTVKDREIAILLEEIYPEFVFYIPEELFEDSDIAKKIKNEIQKYVCCGNDDSGVAKEFQYSLYQRISRILRMRYPEFTAKDINKWILVQANKI